MLPPAMGIFKVLGKWVYKSKGNWSNVAVKRTQALGEINTRHKNRLMTPLTQ